MKNETIETLCTRRSIRSYRPDPVPEELLEEVLRAGLYAPSGMNRQPVTLVAVSDRETRDALSRLNAAGMGRGGDPFYGAPVVIVVLTDPTLGITAREDGALALGNMLNAAHALGLGSCWVHRAREEFESDEGKALLAAWGLPTHLVGIGHCLLGYAAVKEPEAAPRREGRIVRV